MAPNTKGIVRVFIYYQYYPGTLDSKMYIMQI